MMYSPLQFIVLKFYLNNGIMGSVPVLDRLHQQNYKNLFGLLAILAAFSIVGKMESGNKFDKLTIYSRVY